MRTYLDFVAYCSIKTGFVKTEAGLMSISNNLLYLLLLYAVLDDSNRLSTSNGILLALGIMLFGYFRRVMAICCNNWNGNNNNNNFTTTTTTTTTNPFQTINDLL